jgi:putative sigma-54 modulation protein
MDVSVRGTNIELSPTVVAHVERRLYFALGRFGRRVRAARVRMTDVNGPKGGLDTECHIVLRLDPSGSLEISDLGGDVYAAVDAAADRVSRSIGRRLARQGAGMDPRLPLRGRS